MQTTVVETTRERIPLNGVDTPTLFATINAVKGNAGAGQVPVPRHEPLGRGHAQPHRRSTRSAAPARSHAHARAVPVRRRSSGRPGRQGQGADAGRVPAARARRLPHGGHRQHRRRARRHVDLSRVDDRGRHRPARHPRAVQPGRNGYQGIRVTFKISGRRACREAPPDRRAVARPVRGVRRADQRRAGRRVSSTR